MGIQLILFPMLLPDLPALVLAPMDGITDAPMREFLGGFGAFSWAVTEFLRVSQEPLPAKVFRREVPELAHGGKTRSGLPVQVQLLGGDPAKMAATAINAVRAGASAIDINFGCPAPVVNRHDGGAMLLQHPCRIRELVRAVRDAMPPEVPVSAKLRLGWDSTDDIHENAAMAAEGGASWLTIHARTRTQGYQPPVYWKPIGIVRTSLGIPVIANGDIWTLDDFKLCADQTGCRHFMIGRSALANPRLSHAIALELGLPTVNPLPSKDWMENFQLLAAHMGTDGRTIFRLKQWMNLAAKFGNFEDFERLKYAKTVGELFATSEEFHA